MDKIPVIGVAIVNGIHWLNRLIWSIDYPVNNLVIWNNNGKGELDEQLDLIKQIKHPLIDKIHVCNLPCTIPTSLSFACSFISCKNPSVNAIS